MRSFLKRLITVFGSALILLFFSEYYFLNEGPVKSLLGTLAQPLQLIYMQVELTLFYALFAYIFLIVVNYFNVKTWSDLLLAGAIFGWATEALIVPIVYEAVPFSFIFPSISWHALIDVLLGWYLVRVIMRRDQPIVSAMLFVALGVIWAFWATWFWVDTSPDALAPILPADFELYALVTSVFWIVGLILADYLGTDDFQPSKWEVGIIFAIASILFVGMALPFLPSSLFLLPVIVLTIYALYRSQKNDDVENKLHILHSTRPKWLHYVIALLMPMTASLVYQPLFKNQIGIPTEDLTFLLFLIGFVSLVVALMRPFTKRKVMH